MKKLIDALTEVDEAVGRQFQNDLERIQIKQMRFDEEQKNPLRGSYDSYGYGAAVEFDLCGTTFVDVRWLSTLANYLEHSSVLYRLSLNKDVVGNEVLSALSALLDRSVRSFLKIYSKEDKQAS